MRQLQAVKMVRDDGGARKLIIVVQEDGRRVVLHDRAKKDEHVSEVLRKHVEGAES